MRQCPNDAGVCSRVAKQQQVFKVDRGRSDALKYPAQRLTALRQQGRVGRLRCPDVVELRLVADEQEAIGQQA